MKDHPEEGSGTALALGLIAVLLILIVSITGIFGVMKAKQRASTAADLSALAAADTARGLRSGEPCQVAANVAEDNDAHLIACVLSTEHPGTVDIRVGSPIQGSFSFLQDAEAISRAGPP